MKQYGFEMLDGEMVGQVLWVEDNEWIQGYIEHPERGNLFKIVERDVSEKRDYSD